MKRVRLVRAPGRISTTHESKTSLWQAGAALLLSLAAISLMAAVAPERTPTTQRHHHLSISPSSIDFGNVTIGQSASQTVTLTNSRSGTITISQASVNGVGLSLSSLAVPLSLGKGMSASFNVTFTPQVAGSVSGSLTVTSNATGSPAKIALSGTGVSSASPQLTVVPSSASFPQVVVGSTNSQTITLRNTGSASLSVSQASVSGSSFSLSGLSLPLSLSPNQSRAFNVQFTPQAAGNASESLSLWSNAPGSPTIVAVSGTGVAATFLLTANPTSLDFGNVDVGSKSTQSLSLSATGNSNVTISQVSVSGAGFSANGVSSQQTLMPGQTATLGVTFAPTASGSANANCSIASNATGSPLKILLSGIGVTVTSHSAVLSWIASISTNVAGYNIYRGTTSGGPYPTKVGALVTGTSYTDTTVQPGTTYYYVATAVDGSGSESLYSNQATAPIPSP